MNKNTIKDDDLENVSGGTQKEIADLKKAFACQGLDPNSIKRALIKHGIDASLYDNDHRKNIYRDKTTDEKLTHEQVIELIKKNHWRI